MQRIALFFLVLALPQLCFANNVETLKKIIDEYNYALEVEWDQKDLEFIKRHDQILMRELFTLLDNGLTKQDLKSAFPYVDTTKLSFELEDMDFSNIEAMKEFIRLRQKSYARGANWSGEVVVVGLGVLAGISLVILIISAQVKRENIRQDCLNTYTGPDAGAACAYRAGPVQLMPWNVD